MSLVMVLNKISLRYTSCILPLLDNIWIIATLFCYSSTMKVRTLIATLSSHYFGENKVIKFLCLLLRWILSPLFMELLCGSIWIFPWHAKNIFLPFMRNCVSWIIIRTVKNISQLDVLLFSFSKLLSFFENKNLYSFFFSCISVRIFFLIHNRMLSWVVLMNVSLEMIHRHKNCLIE